VTLVKQQLTRDYAKGRFVGAGMLSSVSWSGA
jgi:hypothetical protein